MRIFTIHCSTFSGMGSARYWNFSLHITTSAEVVSQKCLWLLKNYVSLLSSFSSFIFSSLIFFFLSSLFSFWDVHLPFFRNTQNKAKNKNRTYFTGVVLHLCWHLYISHDTLRLDQSCREVSSSGNFFVSEKKHWNLGSTQVA